MTARTNLTSLLDLIDTREVHNIDDSIEQRTQVAKGTRPDSDVVVNGREGLALDRQSGNVDALSGQALMDEIYLQTRIELWGEGKSYLSLKRNQGTVLRGANHLSNVGVAINYDDERLTFEIPQLEIQNNPEISTQN